jgi:hypothetical protein
VAVALELRDVLERLGLHVFPKVSGGKGLHLHVPLNTPTTYRVTQPFARAVAELLEKGRPTIGHLDMDRKRRRDRVFIDWSQNAKHKTTVAAYSLRAKSEEPLVSAPVDWEELQRASTRRDGSALVFRPADVVARIKGRDDLFSPVLTLQQGLPTGGRPGTRPPTRMQVECHRPHDGLAARGLLCWKENPEEGCHDSEGARRDDAESHRLAVDGDSIRCCAGDA